MVQDSQGDGHDPLFDAVDVLVWLAEPGEPGVKAMKVSAAIKIIHRATGIEVVSATESTQLANRTRALAILRDRLASRPR